MKTYVMIIPICHYPTIENFYVNVFYAIKNIESAWTIYYLGQETQRQSKDYVIRFTYNLIILFLYRTVWQINLIYTVVFYILLT